MVEQNRAVRTGLATLALAAALATAAGPASATVPLTAVDQGATGSAGQSLGSGSADLLSSRSATAGSS